MNRNMFKFSLFLIIIFGMLTAPANGQTALEVESPSFSGVLHDNLSNKKRQGSAFTPLVLKTYPAANLFRNDALGLNFEHNFNGAKEQHDVSMFTQPNDPCRLKELGKVDFKFASPLKAPNGELRLR